MFSLITSSGYGPDFSMLPLTKAKTPTKKPAPPMLLLPLLPSLLEGPVFCKKSGIFKVWKERFFKLKTDFLLLYEIVDGVIDDEVDIVLSLQGKNVAVRPDVTTVTGSSVLSIGSKKEKIFLSIPNGSFTAVVDAMGLDHSPPTLTDFDVVKAIGKGGYGEVFLAKSKRAVTQKGLLVALKVIPKHSPLQHRSGKGAKWRSPGGLKATPLRRLIHERSALESLRGHPNITSLVYAFQDSRHWYLCTEYCVQGELFGLSLKQPHMPPERVRKWAAQLVSAIEFLHSQGYVHRDIKLENVLVTANDTVKLADFGFAVHLPSARDSGKEKEQLSKGYGFWGGRSRGKTTVAPEGISRRKRLSFCGTHEYMAPEVVRNTGMYGYEVDWWALGILCYELLYGRTPFASNVGGRPALYKRIELDDPKFKPTPKLNPKNLLQTKLVLQKLVDFIRQLLAKSPYHRLGGPRYKQARDHTLFDRVDWMKIRWTDGADDGNDDDCIANGDDDGKEEVVGSDVEKEITNETLSFLKQRRKTSLGSPSLCVDGFTFSPSFGFRVLDDLPDFSLDPQSPISTPRHMISNRGPPQPEEKSRDVASHAIAISAAAPPTTAEAATILFPAKAIPRTLNRAATATECAAKAPLTLSHATSAPSLSGMAATTDAHRARSNTLADNPTQASAGPSVSSMRSFRGTTAEQPLSHLWFGNRFCLS